MMSLGTRRNIGSLFLKPDEDDNINVQVNDVGSLNFKILKAADCYYNIDEVSTVTTAHGPATGALRLRRILEQDELDCGTLQSRYYSGT